MYATISIHTYIYIIHIISTACVWIRQIDIYVTIDKCIYSCRDNHQIVCSMITMSEVSIQTVVVYVYIYILYIYIFTYAFTNHSSGHCIRIKLSVHCVIILIYQFGHPEISQLLIAHGADVDAQGNMNKWTPIYFTTLVSINHSVILSSTVLSCMDPDLWS